MMGDMASSLMGGRNLQRNAEVEKALSTVPAWTEIRALLELKMASDVERNFRSNLPKGYGPASPLHKIRLYDESNKEKDIRVT